MQKFYPNTFYHIYNRGNNGDKLFYCEENCKFFLKKLSFCLGDYLDIFAFVLMPNHFHLLVRTKEISDKNLAGLGDLPGLERFNAVISKKFSNFFNGYAKAINKQQNRHGSLFEKPFKRKIIDNPDYLIYLIYYIHRNPVHHGFVDRMGDWFYSSHNIFLSKKQTKLNRKEVLSWFSGKDGFLLFHDQKQDLSKINEYIIE